MTLTNDFDQPIGPPLGAWRPPAFPAAEVLPGRLTELAPLRRDVHADQLAAEFADAKASLWTYLPFGPFAGAQELGDVFDELAAKADWQPFAVTVGGRAVGFASYLRIDPGGGVIEIGSIAFSPSLQRTTAATEALFLLIDHSFQLGYRRCEWKCDDLNAPSRAAAQRLGFTYEGTFRKATHYRGRSRDTAWFSIIDSDWPALREAIVAWLDPTNFSGDGRQIQSLESFRV